jgi:signal transduction histidine kinase
MSLRSAYCGPALAQTCCVTPATPGRWLPAGTGCPPRICWPVLPGIPIAGRSRLLLSLGIAELTGILASAAVVILLTRRSIRPLTQALALQRRFVADASHELRAPLTVLHTRIQLLSRRFDDGDAHEAKERSKRW